MYPSLPNKSSIILGGMSLKLAGSNTYPLCLHPCLSRSSSPVLEYWSSYLLSITWRLGQSQNLLLHSLRFSTHVGVIVFLWTRVWRMDMISAFMWLLLIIYINITSWSGHYSFFAIGFGKSDCSRMSNQYLN